MLHTRNNEANEFVNKFACARNFFFFIFRTGVQLHLIRVAFIALSKLLVR